MVVRPAGSTTLNGDPSTRTVPASLVRRLEGTPGAARVDGNVQALGVFVVGTDHKVVGGLGAPTYGISYSDAPAEHGVPGLTIIAGRAPHGPHEVVLDARTAEKAGYFLGSTVPIVTATRRAVLQEKLVGLAGYADNVSLAGATLTVFDVPTAQRLFLKGKPAFTNLWVTADPGVSQATLRDAVAQRLPPHVQALTGADAADESASQVLRGVKFLQTFLLIFAAVALVVGAYLIVNTFSILVAQRSRELALLRALGASRRQVSRSVLLEALVLGLLGSTIGLLLGVGLAYAIRWLIGLVGLDLGSQSLTLTPRAVVAGYATGVLVTMAAAWLPARRTGRIMPVQALGDVVALPESSIRRRFALGVLLVVGGAGATLEGLFGSLPHSGYWVGGGILAVLLGVTATAPLLCRPLLLLARATYAGLFRAVGNLAGQNALRNPRRTTATASALMIGLALASTMSIIGASAKASVDRTIEQNFIGSYVVGSAFGQPFSTSVAGKIQRVPGVTKVVRQRFAFVEADGKRSSVTGVDPAQLGDFGLTLTGGSPDLAGRTVLVNAKYAADHGLAVGDSVTLGKLPVGTRAFRVGGIFEDTPLVFDLVTDARNLTAAGFADSDNFLIVFTSPHAGNLLPRLQQQVAKPPDRDRAGRAAVRRPAARADRPARADGRRPARAGARHRGARDREHPRPVHHRAHARDRPAAGDRARPWPAAADGDPGVGGDGGARGGARGRAGRLSSGWRMMYAVRDQGLDVIAVPWTPARRLPRSGRRDRGPGGRAAGPPGGPPRRPDRHLDRPDRRASWPGLDRPFRVGGASRRPRLRPGG